MKVLHVIASVDTRGGGPIAGVLLSSKIWMENGHERNIVCLDSVNDPWVADCPVKAFAVGINSKWYKALKCWIPWLRYGYTPHLRTWLDANARNYDAVIVNGLWNYASYGSWRSLRKSGIPYFIFPHGMLDSWSKKENPRKYFFKELFWVLFERKVLRDAQGVLYTCEAEKLAAKAAFRHYEGVDFVVGYGTARSAGKVELQKSIFYSRFPAVRGRKIILFLSRIHPIKGVDLLVEAFSKIIAEYPGYDLVIAGPDQSGLKETLSAVARNLGSSDRIHWVGMLNGDAKWGAYYVADYFVQPSHRESFGIAVTEALSAGLPVLITNKVNIYREIELSLSGHVVDDTLNGITKGLRHMCSLSEQQLEIMGRNALRCFMANYDLNRNAMGLLELIKEEISRGLRNKSLRNKE